jgi:hypothetical protein
MDMFDILNFFFSFNASFVRSSLTPPRCPYKKYKGEEGKYANQVSKGDLLVEV